jgi:hypothetical protein
VVKMTVLSRATQEIPSITWHSRVRCRAQHSSPQDPNLSHMNLVHPIYFNIILPLLHNIASRREAEHFDEGGGPDRTVSSTLHWVSTCLCTCGSHVTYGKQSSRYRPLLAGNTQRDVFIGGLGCLSADVVYLETWSLRVANKLTSPREKNFPH